MAKKKDQSDPIPTYKPPVPTLADYFKPAKPTTKQQTRVAVDKAKDSEEALPEYNPPVPSLADYYEPPTERPMITTEAKNSEQEPQDPKSEKKKSSKKKAKRKKKS